MEESFIKTYGIFIGFLLGLLGMYIKHFIDKKLEAKKSKNKLKKLCSLISESPPPEWIKTYTEPEVEIILDAFHANGSNMAKFETRVQAIDAYIKQIEKDIYSNLSTNEIIRFNTIKMWAASVIKQIKEDDEKIKALDFSASIKLSEYDSIEDLSKEELKKLDTLIEIAQENQTNYNSHIIGSSLFFLMVGFGQKNMLEACENNIPTTLDYNYEYNADDVVKK